MKKLAFIIVIGALTAVACKKTEDSEAPVITVFTPTAGQMMHFDSVYVNFKVEDDDLHEVGFSIMRASDDSVLYNMPSAHVHEVPFIFNDTLVVPVPGHTDSKIKVEAADHNENASEKTVNFHIHPM